jgi:ABC-2 type transport system permease protein
MKTTFGIGGGMFLQLRNELWKLFGKKRTYIGFGAFLVAQNAMLVAFHYSRWEQRSGQLLADNGHLTADYLGALTVAVIMLIPQVVMLMPLYACLVGGDMVAKEAEDGTLRMILCRPISRLRLLTIKWLAGVIFCLALVLTLGLMAVGFARLWFPWTGLFVFVPGPMHVFAVMPAGEGLRLYLAAQTIMALNACAMFSLAFMFSCCNMKPAAATIVALSFLILSLVMENLPFFEDYKDFFLTHHFRCWVLVFGRPLDWPQIVESVCVVAATSLTALVLGCTAFQVRDIKS